MRDRKKQVNEGHCGPSFSENACGLWSVRSAEAFSFSSDAFESVTRCVHLEERLRNAR